RAEGSLGLDTPVGRVRLPLSHEGTFEVPKVPKVDFGTPRIGQISASGATVEFPLSLTNRNGFPLPVQDVTGALQIAGANVGSLSTGNLGALAARGTKQLTLPLTVRFLEAGAAAAALRRGNGQVRFSGSLKSGQMAMPVELAEVLEFRR
ncbi:MAG TPA: LEA type 2 family protein, partial [Myxococcaceae bacterium]|nr:LEA type 2 family protein [Myxococcaceae bacterium]